MSNIRVRDIFPIQGGIMYAISDIGGYEFNSDMDLLLLSKCGMREISPVVCLILDDKERLSSNDIRRLARLILSEYGDAWSRIKDTLLLEYNPLTETTYHEEETTDITGENEDSSTEQHTQDVSAMNTSAGTYIPDNLNASESKNTASNKSKAVRTLDKTSSATSYRISDLVQSEIALRVNSRFTDQVLNDVKNYIAMMLYD